MSVSTKARAKARALLAGVSMGPQVLMGITAGAVIGLSLGGAYLAGGMATDAAVHAKVSRIAQAAGGDFSDQGLAALGAGDPEALSVALRYDPSLMLAPEGGERQTAALSEQLNARAGKQNSNFARAAAIAVSNPAARPWTASPLDAARQLDCLTQAVYYEARGETPSGQAAVAQVVLNRVRHPAFPKSVCAVVFQGAQSGRSCQFSFACNGAMRGRREGGAWERAERVASRALDGYVMGEVGNATHFHVTSINPRWHNLLRVSQIGTHVFYRFGGRNGSPSSFVAQPDREEVPLEAKPILASLTILPVEPQDALSSAAHAVVDAVVRTEAPSAIAAPAPIAKPEPTSPKTEAMTVVKPS